MFRQIKKAFQRPFRDIIINTLASSVLVNTCFRNIIYRIYGMKLGNIHIKPGCTFDSNDIEIGDETWINYNCVFNNSTSIKIGPNCDIAFGVTFVCSTHKIGNDRRRAGYGISLPINIEEACWIGAGVIILPGVTIGKGCIVGAGSVVTKDCDSNTLYAGNPARPIKKLLQSGE